MLDLWGNYIPDLRDVQTWVEGDREQCYLTLMLGLTWSWACFCGGKTGDDFQRAFQHALFNHSTIKKALLWLPAIVMSNPTQTVLLHHCRRDCFHLEVGSEPWRNQTNHHFPVTHQTDAKSTYQLSKCIKSLDSSQSSGFTSCCP